MEDEDNLMKTRIGFDSLDNQQKIIFLQNQIIFREKQVDTEACENGTNLLCSLESRNFVLDMMKDVDYFSESFDRLSFDESLQYEYWAQKITTLYA